MQILPMTKILSIRPLILSISIRGVVELRFLAIRNV